MIAYHYEINFKLQDENIISNWIERFVKEEGGKVAEINFIFCNDEYLHNINLKYLNHDTYTDIISFDDSIGKLLSGDIFISVERVKENAKEFYQTFELELFRVISHGVLHFLGYKDKTDKESKIMRQQENKCISILHTLK